MESKYKVIVEPSADGGYVAYIPRLQGCITQAESKAEVLDMIEDAKKAWSDTALNCGIPVPEPVEVVEPLVKDKMKRDFDAMLEREIQQAADGDVIDADEAFSRIEKN